MPVTHVPVSEQIMEELVKRLQLCRYVQEVIRLLKAPDEYTPQSNQILVYGSSMARATEWDCPSTSPAIAYRWAINITANVLHSEKSVLPIETGLEVARADIIKAVTNATAWWNFGSRALNSEWLAPSYAYGTGFQSVTQPLSILYRVKESDPFTVHL